MSMLDSKGGLKQGLLTQEEKGTFEPFDMVYDLDAVETNKRNGTYQQPSFSKFEDKELLKNIREMGSLGDFDEQLNGLKGKERRLSMLRKSQIGQNPVMPQKMTYDV